MVNTSLHGVIMKMNKTRTASFIVASLCLIGASLSAQESTPDAALTFSKSTPIGEVQSNCIGMEIVQHDDVYQCSPKADKITSGDSLDTIIDDMAKENLRRDPVQAGSEGNREALRHLPSATQAAITENITTKRALYKRYQALNGENLQGK